MLRDPDGTPRFEKREIDDVPLNEDDDPDGPGGRWGFLMPEPVDGQFDSRAAMRTTPMPGWRRPNLARRG